MPTILVLRRWDRIQNLNPAWVKFKAGERGWQREGGRGRERERKTKRGERIN